MKVRINRDSLMRADWWEVFKDEPVQVELAGAGLYRVDLNVLSFNQIRELVRVVARRRKIPVDRCEDRIRMFGCVIPATDVMVIDDEEGVLF